MFLDQEAPTPINLAELSPDLAYISAMNRALAWSEATQPGWRGDPEYRTDLNIQWWDNAQAWVERAGDMPVIEGYDRRQIALYLTNRVQAAGVFPRLTQEERAALDTEDDVMRQVQEIFRDLEVA